VGMEVPFDLLGTVYHQVMISGLSGSIFCKKNSTTECAFLSETFLSFFLQPNYDCVEP
jgi:hypothetical protein